MTRALIVTEGKDDVRALREILTRELDLTPLRDQSPIFGESEELLVNARADHAVALVPAGNRGRAARFTRAFIADGKLARNGFDRLGIAFDPDGDTNEQCDAWLRKAALDESWDTKSSELGYRVIAPHGELELVPLAWDGGRVFDELPDHLRSVERVATGVLQAASSEDSALLLELLSVLQSRGRTLSWKTTFRLLNAVRKPDAESGFVAQVFGQDPGLRAGVLPVLQETRLWQRLRFLAGVTQPTA